MEAAGVEPASEATRSERLRAYLPLNIPGPARERSDHLGLTAT